MCAGTSDCGCGCNLQIPRGPRGFQGEPGPAPNITVQTNTLAPGSQATAQVRGTSPNLTIAFGIPQGAPGVGTPGTPGAPGIPAFAPLLNNFTQPSVGFTAVIQTSGSFQWAVQDEPIFISGGGKYTVTANPTAPYTTLFIRNDGGTGNAAPGVLVAANGASAQITPTGRDGSAGGAGTPGAPGTPGAAGVIPVVSTIPVAAPLPNERFTIYADVPANPTVVTGYSWNGSAWINAVNLTPAAGTQTVFVNGDPNVLLPAGPVGTVGIRTDLGTQLDYYVKSTVSSWTLQKSITIANTITQTVIAGSNLLTGEVLSTDRVIGAVRNTVVTPTIGNYNIDNAYEVTHIQIDKAIELDWDANYAEDATWIVYVENIDGSSQNITYAAGVWAKATGLSLPATIAAGETQVFVIRLNADKTRMVIENTYLITNV